MRFATTKGEPDAAVAAARGHDDIFGALGRGSERVSAAREVAGVMSALLRAAVEVGTPRPRAGLGCGDGPYAMWSLDAAGNAVPCGTAPAALFRAGSPCVVPLAAAGVLDLGGAALPVGAMQALGALARQAALCLEALETTVPAAADSEVDLEPWWEEPDVDRLVRRAVSDVARLCDADSAAVALLNPQSGAARVAYSEDAAEGAIRWHGVTSGRRNAEALLRVLRTGDPLEFRWNPETEALKLGLLPAGPEEGSWLALPLTDEGGTFGVLDIQSREPRRFGPEERERLERAARFLARLLARLGEAVRQADARRRDVILLEAVSELADESDARRIAAALARATRRLWPDADLAYAMLPQREGGLWSIAAVESDEPENQRRGWARTGEGFAGWVIQTRQPLCVSDATNDPRRGALDHGQGVTAGAWVPMRRDDTLLGLLCVASTRSERRYDADDLESLAMLARQGMVALERSRERHASQESFWDAIEAISGAIDARDGYTHGHSRNVTEYAVAIATRMGLPHREIQTLRASALLHDIGKIGIPDHILNKPANLTPDERVVMESHPEVGYQILLRAPSLQAILPGVRYHHERPDGKGYPCNLSGDALPLQARIMAVADAFDAMTSDRVYRKRMTVEKATGILREGKGTQWDPECVDHFLALVDARATPRLQLLAAEDSGRQYLPSLGVDVFGA